MIKKNSKVLVIVLIVVFIGILRFSQSMDDFNTYNSKWHGGEEIKNELSKNHTVISMPDLDQLTGYESGKTALIILGPDENFSTTDKNTIREFINGGGLFILADDFGTGNNILNNLTSGIAFSNLLVLDDVNYWENNTFPIITTSMPNISNITLNYPTSLVIKGNSTNILASSSQFSWLSPDGNIRVQSGSFPVIAEIPFGQGVIVAIADPSILINSMLPFEDNRLLLEYLVKNRTDVVFDEQNHTPVVPAFHYILKTNPYAQYLFAAIFVSLALLYMRRDQLSKDKNNNTNKTHIPDDVLELDEDNIITDILSRNKWDERKVKRFKNELKRE